MTIKKTCPYRETKCHEPYNHTKCRGDYEKCFENGRLKFIEQYDAFGDTELMLGIEGLEGMAGDINLKKGEQKQEEVGE